MLDIEHNFGLLLSYLFLLFNGYIAHIFAADYVNEKFYEGWMVYATVMFLGRLLGTTEQGGGGGCKFSWQELARLDLARIRPWIHYSTYSYAYYPFEKITGTATTLPGTAQRGKDGCA